MNDPWARGRDEYNEGNVCVYICVGFRCIHLGQGLFEHNSRYYRPSHTLAYKREREILDGLFCASISSLMGFLDETCICGVESELSNVFPTRCRSRIHSSTFFGKASFVYFLASSRPHNGAINCAFSLRHASFRRPFIYFFFFQIGSRTVWPDWKTSGNLSI